MLRPLSGASFDPTYRLGRYVPGDKYFHRRLGAVDRGESTDVVQCSPGVRREVEYLAGDFTEVDGDHPTRGPLRIKCYYRAPGCGDELGGPVRSAAVQDVPGGLIGRRGILRDQAQQGVLVGAQVAVDDGARGEAERVGPRMRVVDVRVLVGGGGQTERVRADVAGGLGVVVAEVVVVEAGFGVGVLTGEPQRARGGAAVRLLRSGRRAPQRGAALPDELSVAGQEFGGGAGDVGDDGEETDVDVGLGEAVDIVPGRAVFDLGQRIRRVRLVVPGGGPAVGRGLLGEARAVPGEGGLLGDRAVGGEAVLGRAAAEGVIGVAPVRSVGGGDAGEAVFGVPVVGPAAGLSVEQTCGAADEAALGVVRVAGTAGPPEDGSGELPLAGLHFGWSGGAREVAEGVVEVGLGPVAGADLGDAAGPVQLEPAGPGGEFVDLGEVAVGAVGVRAVLQEGFPGRPAMGDGLGGQAVGAVPGLAERELGTERAGGLAAGGVEGEADPLTGGVQGSRPVGRVVGPGGDDATGRTALGSAAQLVVGVRHRAAVDGLAQRAPQRVVAEGGLGVCVGGAQQSAGGVVGVVRGGVGAALFDDRAALVPAVGEGFTGAVGAGGELAGRVVGVAERAVVEVGFRDHPAGRIVGVTPGPALGVGDGGEVQLAVVAEGVAGAVGVGAAGGPVEGAGGVVGGTAGRVGVGDQVALAVPGPGLAGAVGVVAAARPALDGPPQVGGAAQRVGDRDDPAEGVPDRGGGVAQRVGDGGGQARLGGGDVAGVAERVGHRGQMACRVVAEPGLAAERIGGAQPVSAVVVRVLPHLAAGLGEPHRLPEGVVRTGRRRAVRRLDRGEIAL